MKMNKLFAGMALIVLLMDSLSHGMIVRKSPPTGPNISPLHKRVLENAAIKNQEKLIAQIKEDLPEKLNRLYTQALPDSLFTQMQQELGAIHMHEMDPSDREIVLELQNGVYDLIAQYRDHENRLEDFLPVEDIEPILDQFKKEKGFDANPKVDALQTKELVQCYATYFALATALKQIDRQMRLD